MAAKQKGGGGAIALPTPPPPNALIEHFRPQHNKHVRLLYES